MLEGGGRGGAPRRVAFLVPDEGTLTVHTVPSDLA